MCSGAFLIYAGVHMMFSNEGEAHPEKNRPVRFIWDSPFG